MHGQFVFIRQGHPRRTGLQGAIRKDLCDVLDQISDKNVHLFTEVAMALADEMERRSTVTSHKVEIPYADRNRTPDEMAAVRELIKGAIDD